MFLTFDNTFWQMLHLFLGRIHMFFFYHKDKIIFESYMSGRDVGFYRLETMIMFKNIKSFLFCKFPHSNTSFYDEKIATLHKTIFLITMSHQQKV